MKRLLILLCLVGCAAPMAAQQRPLAGTTIQTTDTTANSALIGCAVGSTTCTGGIKAGPIAGSTAVLTGSVTGASGVFTGAISAAAASFSGLFTDTLVGAHAFSGAGTGDNSLRVRNTTAGVANSATVGVVDDSGFDLTLQKFSSTFTPATYKLANGGALLAEGTGGLSIVTTHASGAIRFYTNTTPLQRWGINSAGDFTIGTSAHIFASNGTPTVASGFGTSPVVIGTDYAFQVSGASGASTTGTITFAHTWSTQPICVATSFTTPVTTGIALATSTTQVILTYTSSTAVALYVICFGY